VIHARLLEKGREPLVELFGPLMSMIVLSYRGQAAARRELERPPPSLADARPSDGRRIDPLGDLGMRITYRTVRVLRVIAAHPQANNREIAMRAEVADQGQVSKLLARLQRLGLIHNEANSGKGAPNAWSLTTRGRQVEQAIRVEAPARGAGGSPAAGRSG
jgi:DNA-binding MarR family transcriptional regulator